MYRQMLTPRMAQVHAFGWIDILTTGLWAFSVIILLTAVIYWIRKNRMAPMGTESQYVTPLDIVKERYAKGEISREQFTQLKKDLSES